MSIVVPKKVYIDYQERREQDDTVKLGFATYADNEDKAFLKRKDTIDSWAERPLWRYERSEDGTRKHVKNDPKFGAEYLDNEPRSGFKIPRHVRRWGWNGGNVVWRIEDPRGFELEIPSENMGQLLMHCSIVNGEIQDQCVWGWNKTGGSRVVLLPINSEPYTEALKDTLLHNSKVSIREVNIGDRIILKNGTEGIFYGGHHYLTAEYMPSVTHTGWHRGRRADETPIVDEETTGYGYDGRKVKSLRRHFLLLDDGNWYIQSGFKVALIKEKTDKPLTPDEAFEVIDQSIADGKVLTETADTSSYAYDSGCGELGLVKKKDDRGHFELIPTSLDEIKKRAGPRTYSQRIIYDHNNQLVTAWVLKQQFEDGNVSHGRDARVFLRDYLDRQMIITQSWHSNNTWDVRQHDDGSKFDPTNSNRKYYFLVYKLRDRTKIVD